MTNVVLVMSKPGAGKSHMIGLTAPKRPLHVFDLDRKMTTMAWARERLESGDITVDELKVPMVENTMEERTKELVMKLKPREPKGWIALSDMFANITRNENAMKAGSWSLDSFTVAAAHLERLISHYFGKPNWEFQQWGALLKMLEDSVTILIDAAKEHGKDIYFTVHEKEIELPTPETKVIHSGDSRKYIGALDLGIGVSVAGQFSARMPVYFTEVYALKTRVTEETGAVEYYCVVKPDGLRPLRTSYKLTDKNEWPCDFRQIWGVK